MTGVQTCALPILGTQYELQGCINDSLNLRQFLIDNKYFSEGDITMMNDNSPDNLKAVTIQEHYDIHLKQGDHMACYLISLRMNKTPEELSEIAKKVAKKNAENGTSFFCTEAGKEYNKKMLKDGTHPLQGRNEEKRQRTLKQAEEGKHPMQMLSKSGKHHFYGGEVQKKTAQRLLAEGKHFNQINRTCPHCGKNGNGPVMLKWHFNNCKDKK